VEVGTVAPAILYTSPGGDARDLAGGARSPSPMMDDTTTAVGLSR
jgi:hypothetical protein